MISLLGECLVFSLSLASILFSMVNRLLGVVVVYALVLSCLFGFFTLVDYHQLNYSVSVQDLDREMAHRINVFADGTWFLLSNLMAVCALGFRSIRRSA